MRYRRVLVGVAPMLALLMIVHPVTAGRLWCSADPVVSLDHRLVSISVAIPAEYLLLVNGPTALTVKAPPSLDRALVVSDVGFMGHGTVVTFVNGGGAVKDEAFPVEIRVSVPVADSSLSSDESIPLQVTVTPDGQLPITVEGTAESTVVKLTILGR